MRFFFSYLKEFHPITTELSRFEGWTEDDLKKSQDWADNHTDARVQAYSAQTLSEFRNACLSEVKALRNAVKKGIDNTDTSLPKHRD